MIFYFIVKCIKFGYNKQSLQKYNNLKLIIKFLIRDESKILKNQAYQNIIELNNPLIYFKEDIEINDIKLSDSLIIKYNKVNEPENEENRVVIKIKKLKQNIEEDIVWTIGNYSFINLIYELIPIIEEKKKLFMSHQILNNENIENNKNTISGDLAGELGGEATCSTGSTMNKEKDTLYKQKKFIKDDNKFKTIPKYKNSSNYSNCNNYQILEDNSIFNDENNIFSKEYLSKLNFSEFQYDTFCQCVLITGLKFLKVNLIEKSEKFPSPCGHKECSILQSITPSILYSYQNPNKKNQIDINELTPYLIFPLGIKICMAYDSLNEYPRKDKPFMNRIENKKGESFYIISLIYYKQMTFKKFQERYKINPLLYYSNNNKNQNFVKEIEIISKLALNETIFVPECISLISRFPYFYQMGECLKTLITLSDNEKINSFINHLINQIPVPYKNQEIMFYIPNNSIPIKLFSPFNFNLSNYQNFNIFNYFSNQTIITIFYLILMEQQILFIDNDLSLLSSISFLFLNLIYPFSWSNTYIPVLSFSSVKFLESIIPYIMGANESLVEYALENQFIGNKVIFVNIKTNEIYLNNKKGINIKNTNKLLDLPKFPENFENSLNIKLDNIRKLNNKSLIIENLKYIFCKLMVVILNDYLEHCFIIDEDIIFNNESFLDRKKPEEKNFYKELIQTQLFSQFLLSRKEQFIKNKKYINNNNLGYYNNNKNDFDFFNKESKINSNKYGYTYDNLYIDYSLFHDFEKDYLSKFKTLKIDNLPIKIENKSKKALLELNKSSKINGKYSLLLNKSKKNNIDRKLTQILKNNVDNKNIKNNFQNNSFKINPKTIIENDFNNFHKEENDITYIDYLYEESKKNSKKQKKPENETKFLLFPYFLENQGQDIPYEGKDIYIKNKIEEIIKMEKQINKIIKTKNIPDYILPSYKRYEFYSIKEDYKRYFPNSLKISGNNSESCKNFSSDFSSEDEENINIEEIKNKKIYNNNNNYLKKNSINNKEIIFINEWFNIICSSDKKKFKNIETNNLIKLLLNNKENLEYFSDLIFQDYVPLFKYINSNNKKILTHECLNELYKVLHKILPSLNGDHQLICKKITLSFFIYGYYNQKIKAVRYIISKINDYFSTSLILIDKVCPLWNNIHFWKFWFENDLETYKNNRVFMDNESFSFEGNNEYDSNVENNEYEFFLEICKILISLGKSKTFIKKCIFESLAPLYLVPIEITTLEDEVFSQK